MKDLPKNCPRCHSPIPADAPDGLCPACLLMEAAMPADTAAGALGSAPTLEEVSAAFPDLEIVEMIGHGGMGVVFKARQTRLGRLVALKILPPGLAAQPGFTERFNREARALARLNHPNIVAVYDFGESAGFCYLLMEFVTGVNLRQAMRAGVKPEQALTLVPQICEALQFAHDHGVLHRDIKPENILLDTTGKPKLADFGIAKLAGDKESSAGLTLSGAALGTAAYMAPEQIEKPGTVDHRADIYSLGVVLYEMLTGELPLGRFAVPSEKSGVAHGVDEVVMRALEKQRERRQQTATQMKTEVEYANSPARAARRPEPAARRPFSQTATVFLAFGLPVLVIVGVSSSRLFHDSHYTGWWALGVAAVVVAGSALLLAILRGLYRTFVSFGAPRWVSLLITGFAGLVLSAVCGSVLVYISAWKDPEYTWEVDGRMVRGELPPLPQVGGSGNPVTDTKATALSEEGVQLAREQLKAAKARYEAGVSSAQEFEDAQRNLAIAEARGDAVKILEAKVGSAEKALVRGKAREEAKVESREAVRQLEIDLNTLRQELEKARGSQAETEKRADLQAAKIKFARESLETARRLEQEGLQNPLEVNERERLLIATTEADPIKRLEAQIQATERALQAARTRKDGSSAYYVRQFETPLQELREELRKLHEIEKAQPTALQDEAIRLAQAQFEKTNARFLEGQITPVERQRAERDLAIAKARGDEVKILEEEIKFAEREIHFEKQRYEGGVVTSEKVDKLELELNGFRQKRLALLPAQAKQQAQKESEALAEKFRVAKEKLKSTQAQKAPSQRELLTAKIEFLETRLAVLKQLHETGQIPPDFVSSGFAEPEQEIAKLRQELEALRTSPTGGQ